MPSTGDLFAIAKFLFVAYAVLFCGLCFLAVHIAPYRFFEFLTLKNIVTLKSRSEVTQSHLKRHHSIDNIRVPTPLFIFHCNYGRL